MIAPLGYRVMVALCAVVRVVECAAAAEEAAGEWATASPPCLHAGASP